MPKSFNRTKRVGDVIHRCLARLIREEFKDPRVGMATVSSVVVTSDLKQAKVYVTVLEEQKSLETIKILNEASGFFRRQLARAVQLRVVPNILFLFDESVIRGSRLMSIFESLEEIKKPDVKKKDNEEPDA